MMKSRSRSEQGQALVELALVLTFFLLLIAGAPFDISPRVTYNLYYLKSVVLSEAKNLKRD
jgi:hypothetical protein